MIKVTSQFLEKKATIGALMRAVHPPVEGAAYSYPQLKSMRRQAARRGGTIPGLETPLAYERTIRSLQDQGRGLQQATTSGTEPRRLKVEYTRNRGSFAPGDMPGIAVPAMNAPTTAHELGHYTGDLSGVSVGDRGLFGVDGDFKTMLPSEADATKRGLKAMQEAGMGVGARRTAGATLANAYDTYDTAARFEAIPLPKSEQRVSQLAQHLAQRTKTVPEYRVSGRDNPLADYLVPSRNNPLANHYKSLDPIRAKPAKIPGVINFPKDYDIEPVTSTQRTASESFGNHRFKEVPRGIDVRRSNIRAQGNRRRLLRNLHSMPEDLRPVLSSESRKYITDTGNTFGRDAKRGVIQQLKRLRDEYQSMYPKQLKRLQGAVSSIGRRLLTKGK